MGCGPSQSRLNPIVDETIGEESYKSSGYVSHRVTTSRKIPQESQFLNKETAASWRANHNVSIRANLVQTHVTNIEKDYILHQNKELGRGGIGTVFIGECKQRHDLFAIKVCDKSSASVSRLSREIILLKDVDHVNIVRLFCVYETPSRTFFIMELCKGGHLGSLLKSCKDERIDEAWARRLSRQIFSAISHIHTRGICHRDIKLQNILLDTFDEQASQIKLIDFGYGSRFIGALPMRTKVGTPYTIAPEVLRESYDQRCDVWSAGVVLYIMLSGKRPFMPLECSGPLSEAGNSALTTNVLSGRFHFKHPSWSTVSEKAKDFVAQLFVQPYTARMEASEVLEDSWLDMGVGRASVSAALAQDSQSNNIVANIMSNIDKGTPSIRRTGNVAVAFGFQPEKASRLRNIFQAVDIDSSGGLDEKEFCSAMQILCPSLSKEDCSIIFAAIDINADGQISYTEFLAASLDPNCVDVEELNKAFKLLDANGDGFISAAELQTLYKLKLNTDKLVPPPQVGARLSASFALQETEKDESAHPTAGGGVKCAAIADQDDQSRIEATNAIDSSTCISLEVLEMLSACDLDKDGRISYEEFIWGMTGNWIRDIMGDDLLNQTKIKDVADLREAYGHIRKNQADLMIASTGAAVSGRGSDGESTRQASKIYRPQSALSHASTSLPVTPMPSLEGAPIMPLPSPLDTSQNVDASVLLDERANEGAGMAEHLLSSAIGSRNILITDALACSSQQTNVLRCIDI